MFSIRLADLAQQLNAPLHGDGDITIAGLASMGLANGEQITFLSDSRYREKLSECQAAAVVLTEADLPFCPVAALVVKNPYLAYAQIAADAKLGNNVSIGANAVIESGVELGNNVVIGAGCFIGKKAHIGDNSRLWANVSIYHEVIIGKDCLVQSGTVIGSDGFGYANERGNWIKIPQLGSVIIGDRVEIGACTTIDRGALDNTVIGNGVIIDNQCQIAHNVIIGDNTAVAGGVIMAGSLKIGRYCMIGGASVINGHMEICDKVTVTGMGMVMRPITEPGVYSSGIPLQPNKAWRKTAALVLRIDEMQKRLKSLERQVENSDK